MDAQYKKKSKNIDSHEQWTSSQIHGSGRTDAGVHALGQVIHFDFDERPLEKMRFGLDTQTPEDIAVKQVEIVDEHFHARYLVREKTYQFRVDIGKPRSPFRRYYASYYRIHWT